MVTTLAIIPTKPPPVNGPVNNSLRALPFSLIQFLAFENIFFIESATNCSANLPAVASNLPLESVQDAIMSQITSIASPIRFSLFSMPSRKASRITIPTFSILGPFSIIQLLIFLIRPSIVLLRLPFSSASNIPSHIPFIILVPTCITLSKMPPLVLTNSSRVLNADSIPLVKASPQPCDTFSRYAKASSSPEPLPSWLKPFIMLKNSVSCPVTSLIPSFTLSNICNKVSCIADAKPSKAPLTVSSKFSAISAAEPLHSFIAFSRSAKSASVVFNKADIPDSASLPAIVFIIAFCCCGDKPANADLNFLRPSTNLPFTISC